MLPDDLWAEIRSRAEEEGISASQWVREACLAIVYYEKGTDGNRELPTAREKAKRKLR